jgi:hypothetical protein
MLSKFFVNFQFVLANDVRSRTHSSTSFPVQYSLVVKVFEAIQSELLTPSLNELQKSPTLKHAESHVN